MSMGISACVCVGVCVYIDVVLQKLYHLAQNQDVHCRYFEMHTQGDNIIHVDKHKVDHPRK